MMGDEGWVVNSKDRSHKIFTVLKSVEEHSDK